ncbi:MAG TPA: chemotaxis protein CheW [Burkholderiales bacterium]|nr:chemotaxis protein CheW [Burkholderiales bacterium]
MHNTALNLSRGRGTVAVPTQEYLAFRLGDEDYAIDILKVQEIRVFEAVTKLPGAPQHIKGVINLRGLIAPVVDLRIKFGFKEAGYGPFTVVIVLHVHERLVAIVADAVIDVVALTEDEVKPPPEFATSVNVEYVTGLGAKDDQMLIMLDIEKLISSQELGIFDVEAQLP